MPAVVGPNHGLLIGWQAQHPPAALSPTHSALGLQPTFLLPVDVPFNTSLTSTDENSMPYS